jgi:hemerythrin
MPVILEWSNQLATEHPLIDEQHQAMIAIINRLHSCITEPVHRPQFSDQLEQLSNYAMEHFATEERLMSQYNYPHLARHQAQHALLTQQAYALNQRFLGGDLPLDSTVSESIREWFMNHLQGEDRELGLYLLHKQTL